ncbi:MAG: hypothetical protein M9949_14365 [Candidatus Kapabacteria bacterium]|nr:hypothetical protein [Candidatus Kapabacteria bacterium]
MSGTKTMEFLAGIQNSIEMFGKQMNDLSKNLVPSQAEYEIMEPHYFNRAFHDKLKLPTVYRFNQSGMRYYFTIEGQNVTFYPSVTTIIDKTTPLSYGLKKMIGDMGMEKFNAYMKERAHNGTIMHMFVADYLRSSDIALERYFDLDSISTRLALYASENQIPYDISDWQWSLKKDMLSIIQFFLDYQVEPIVAEVVGIYNHNGLKYAGTLDLICEMTIPQKGFWGETYKTGERKGEAKETNQDIRIIAVIDFKSGKSGFFDDHEIQLHMYKQIAEQSFGLQPQKVFNLAPKDWQNEPTYHLKDQTDSIQAKKIPFLLGAFQCEWEDPKEITIINGKINGSDMNKNIKRLPAKEYALNLISSTN